MALSNLTTPGVYVNEISLFPPSVAPVSTAIPAFIGYTEKGPKNVPTRVTTILEYEATFGVAFKEQFEVTISNLGVPTVTNVSVSPSGASPYTMYYHLQMYFANGGGPCWIISSDKYNYASPAILAADFIGATKAIAQAELEDEITLLLAPEAINITGVNADADTASIHNAMLAQCNKLKDRFVIMDVKQGGTSVADDADTFRNDNVGANYLNYGAAYYPHLNTTLSRYYLNEEVVITTDNHTGGFTYDTPPNDRLSTIGQGIGSYQLVTIALPAVGDTFEISALGSAAVILTAGTDFAIGTVNETAQNLVDAINNHPTLSLVARAQMDTAPAFYVVVRSGTDDVSTGTLDITPAGWLTLGTVTAGDNNSVDTALFNTIRAAIALQTSLTLPPSGTMAGIYAAVDNARGVWKAPANVGILSVSGPSIMVTEAQQGGLNVDPTSGKSINAIRSFTGRGTLVWGSRTLEGNSNEWRYVPVRRLFIMVEESCKKASEFVVFESNDKNTWLKVKGMISNFLNDLWQQGALAGSKPEQAYFVQVGLGETMTAQDILEGRMIVTIGMAAVRPAEFIILQFMHKLQES